MEHERNAPLTREEMQRRRPSVTPRERRAMMRRVREHEPDTPEGAARDRRGKVIAYGIFALILIGGIVHRLLTR